MRCTCSSLSMTQGPAISANVSPPPKRMDGLTSIATGKLDIPQQRPRHTALALLVSGANKRSKQRMRLERLGFELGMKLAAQIPRMISDLADLDVGAIGSLAGNPQTGRCQNLLIFAIELVAVTMPLADLRRAISLVREAAFHQQAWPRAQPHGAAQIVDTLQLAQLVNDAMRRARIEFARIGAL